MWYFIFKRVLTMLGLLAALSLVCFFLIQLPPGDFTTAYIAKITQSGDTVGIDFAENLRKRYGLDEPFLIQYWIWVKGLVVGNFGYSFDINLPVSEIFGRRVGMSLLVESLAVVAMWAIAIPIGIYSAVYKYSIGDTLGTIVGFIGLAVPNFLLALIIMYISFEYFDFTVTGLNSSEYALEPWSLAKFGDFLKHVWAPVIVIGSAGTAQIIRVLRANLLDELKKPYVLTARAKGLREKELIWRYPVRVAMNPLISTIGWILPTVISSSVVTSIVLNLPTLSPILLQSLLAQDMYLAGFLILFMGSLTLFGTLVSDILLLLLDPRVRYGMVPTT